MSAPCNHSRSDGSPRCPTASFLLSFAFVQPAPGSGNARALTLPGPAVRTLSAAGSRRCALQGWTGLTVEDSILAGGGSEVPAPPDQRQESAVPSFHNVGRRETRRGRRGVNQVLSTVRSSPMRRRSLRSRTGTLARCGSCTSGPAPGGTPGSSAGATILRSLSRSRRTPSSRSGRTRGGSVTTAKSVRGYGAPADTVLLDGLVF